MEITVKRLLWDDDETLSAVYINGERFCIGIEDAIREKKVWGETAIPDGTYKIGLRTSPKFTKLLGHKMLWVLDVPGFEYVYIHPGNTAKDTHGCFLVGDKLGVVSGRVAVQNSREIYFKLYNKVISEVEKGMCSIQFLTHK
jgi:hypothetical protein